MKIAVYPGSFDPITLGHLNIIRRAASVFDRVKVCVMVNSEKDPMFNVQERMELISRVTHRLGNVEAETSDLLLAEYANHAGASVIVRGLRVVSDFEKEFQMAIINRKMDTRLETVFLAASEKYTYLSSSVVKEMARYGADLSEFVPREIINDIIEKTENRR